MTSEQREYGAAMFAALSHPSRLHIVERLAMEPASVGELARAAGLKQSTASQHLAVLLAAGIVVNEPRGNVRIYRLRGPRIVRILELLEGFYQAHLDDLRTLVSS